LTAQERGVIWTINIRAIEMYFADSRLIQLIQKVINFITMICLIYFDPFYALAINMLFNIPFLFTNLLEVYVLSGRIFKIYDEDLYYLFPILGFEYPKKHGGEVELLESVEKI